MFTKTYSFAGLEHVVGEELKSITMKELSGDDEMKALAMAVQEKTLDKGGMGKFCTLLSIVEVNGEPVSFPWSGLSSLNIKARSLIAAAYDELNNVKPDESAAFLASGKIKI